MEYADIVDIPGPMPITGPIAGPAQITKHSITGPYVESKDKEEDKEEEEDSEKDDLLFGSRKSRSKTKDLVSKTVVYNLPLLENFHAFKKLNITPKNRKQIFRNFGLNYYDVAYAGILQFL